MYMKNLPLFLFLLILSASASCFADLLDDTWCADNGGILKNNTNGGILVKSCQAYDYTNSESFTKKIYLAFTSAFYTSLTNNTEPVKLVVLDNIETEMKYKGAKLPFKIWTLTKKEINNYI